MNRQSSQIKSNINSTANSLVGKKMEGGGGEVTFFQLTVQLQISNSGDYGCSEFCP